MSNTWKWSEWEQGHLRPCTLAERKANMRLVGVTIFSANGNSWDADEIEASPQGNEI